MLILRRLVPSAPLVYKQKNSDSQLNQSFFCFSQETVLDDRMKVNRSNQGQVSYFIEVWIQIQN